MTLLKLAYSAGSVSALTKLGLQSIPNPTLDEDTALSDAAFPEDMRRRMLQQYSERASRATISPAEEFQLAGQSGGRLLGGGVGGLLGAGTGMLIASKAPGKGALIGAGLGALGGATVGHYSGKSYGDSDYQSNVAKRDRAIRVLQDPQAQELELGLLLARGRQDALDADREAAVDAASAGRPPILRYNLNNNF